MIEPYQHENDNYPKLDCANIKQTMLNNKYIYIYKINTY